jgi:hypothetical protein
MDNYRADQTLLLAQERLHTCETNSEIVGRLLNEGLLALESKGHLETAHNRRSEMDLHFKFSKSRP